MATTQPALATAPDGHTLERLAAINADGHPVLSVYINLDPARFPTPAALDAQLGSLLDQLRHEAGPAEHDCLAAWLARNPIAGHRARALAIFSSVKAGIFETAALPAPAGPLAVLDAVPWLEPIAAMISPGPWAVAVLSRRGARLFRGGQEGLSEFAAVQDIVDGRHAQGGWSQARFQRNIEEQVAAHVRRVVALLTRAHRRLPFAHLAVVCSGELDPVLQRALPHELADLLAGVVHADLEHATLDEVRRAVTPVIAGQEADLERELIATLAQALGTGGTGVVGLDEVLSTLRQHRVATLLVLAGAQLTAHRCPACGRLSADALTTCADDQQPLTDVDAVEHLVEEAAHQSVPVVVIRHHRQWLDEHGAVAAILRW